MFKTVNTRLLFLLCFVISVGVFTACKKDKDASSSKVELFSFGPTGAKHGDTLRFIGNNLNKVTAIELTGAKVEQSAFIQQNTELITIIVPKETQQGFVTLKTPSGDIVTKTKLNLNVPVKITTMTAQARPGENITITGDYLNWVNRITFEKNKVVDTFVSKSLNQLVVKVPADAQTGKLMLSTGGTEPMEIITDSVLKVTLPSITALSPNPVKHQANLTITGTNLDLAKQILFTGVKKPVTTFVSQSATQIVVKVPDSSTKGKITLVAASGVTVQSTDDLTLVLPATTSLSPNPIYAGADLTIMGTNLDLVSAISFTGVKTAVKTFVSQSPTQLVVKVPDSTTKGKLTFSIINAAVTSQSSDDLTIILPSITSLSPNPIDIGADLTITGTDLDLVSAISFPGVSAPVTTFVSQSATQIVVKVPVGTAKGKLTFSVVKSAATVQSGTELTINGGPAEVPFKLVVYDDAINSGWQIWNGWGNTNDPANTERVKSGTKAIKITYSDAYGGFQLHPNNTFPLPNPTYTTLRLSIYAGANATATSRVAVYAKDATDPTDAQTKILTLVPGTYTTYEIPLTAFTNNPAKINELVIKNYGTANIVIYVDEIGFY